jgi:hypothetical protein
VITGVSIIAWIPHYYAYFYQLHGSGARVDSAISILSILLVLFSGGIKPVLYISLSSQFRKAVIRSLK